MLEIMEVYTWGRVMKIDLPQEVVQIISTIEEYGGEAYIVGGCVRDRILGRNPHDWDLCTNFYPSKIQSIFKKTLPIGETHGTIGVKIGKEIYEVTTFRRDGEYLDGRRPEKVYFTNELVEDLKRRDFTINAMAYHPVKGLIDPMGGEQDLLKGELCAVGEAKLRFEEDGLRILRLFRFQSVFGFDIEKNTFEAAKIKKDRLLLVANERIGIEMRKLLCGNSPDMALLHMAKSGILEKVFPFDFLEKSFSLLSKVNNKFEIRLATLLFLIPGNYSPEEVTTTCYEALSLSKKERDKSLQLLIWLKKNPLAEKFAVKECLFSIGQEMGILYANLRKQIYNDQESTAFLEQMEEILKEKECYTFPLAISGKDLEEMGMAKGAQIGVVLKDLLEWVWVDSKRNSAKLLLEKAKEISDLF